MRGFSATLRSLLIINIWSEMCQLMCAKNVIMYMMSFVLLNIQFISQLNAAV